MDLSISTGVDFKITSQLWAGLHGVYNHGITEYQNMNESGTLKVKQFGVEASVITLLSVSPKS